MCLRVKAHSPDRLEAYSSSAVFRLFLWMWLVCECVLVQLLHDVWYFNLVSPLGPSTRHNAAFLHSLFCKAFYFGMSVSAIQFTCYLFLARATTRLSTGTAVWRR